MTDLVLRALEVRKCSDFLHFKFLYFAHYNVRPDILGLRNVFRDLAPRRNLGHIAEDTLL